MAGVIVLDASVVIAHFASRDAHHDAAAEFFGTRLDLSFLVHPLTLTEILVGPLRSGRETFVVQQLDALGIAEWQPPAGSALRLARLRVDSGLKLRDCCVLHAAIAAGAPLATFDERLARAAASVGVPLVGLG
jgi:predicted nucleic acid-binding protein